jgi:hypothetical protein
MEIGKRTFQMVLVGLAIVVLAAVGLVVAQNQQPPQSPQAAESQIATETPAAVRDLPADIPRITPAQQDFGAVRKSFDLYAGTALACEKDSEQERAVVTKALAAEEAAAAAPRMSQLPSPLPLPIQVADEVTVVVEQLRGIGRSLDQIAANKEDEADYAGANQLRRVAARIRREARLLREGKSAPDVSLR